jgi:hypothetical protein
MFNNHLFNNYTAIPREFFRLQNRRRIPEVRVDFGNQLELIKLTQKQYSSQIIPKIFPSSSSKIINIFLILWPIIQVPSVGT